MGALRRIPCDYRIVSVSVRLATAADNTDILELMAASRGDDLSEAERAERGFVQGTMDDDTLRRSESTTGVFVAEVDGAFGGFAITNRPGSFSAGPPKRTLDVATDKFPDAALFLYGPAAVSRDVQGRGVLSALLIALSAHLSDRFDVGVAFVEGANAKSLSVHRHYGMIEAGTFQFHEREYVVFTFDVAEMAHRQNGGTP